MYSEFNEVKYEQYMGGYNYSSCSYQSAAGVDQGQRKKVGLDGAN